MERRDDARAESLVDQLHALITEAHEMADEARRARKPSVTMAGIEKQTKVLELIAKLSRALDESTRVNVLVQECERAEAGQVQRLEWLTIDEHASSGA